MFCLHLPPPLIIPAPPRHLFSTHNSPSLLIIFGTGSFYTVQAGLKPMTENDPPVPTYAVAGTTCMPLDLTCYLEAKITRDKSKTLFMVLSIQ